MDKRKILLQLDSDPHPSVFDRVVAVDAGVDEVFSYGGVKPEHVQGLVHGAIFTRDPKELKDAWTGWWEKKGGACRPSSRWSITRGSIA